MKKILAIGNSFSEDATKFLLEFDPVGISYIPAFVGVKEIADKDKVESVLALTEVFGEKYSSNAWAAIRGGIISQIELIWV